jgi:hypothetical protein
MATKFTYDTVNRRFLLNVGVTTLDAKTEFYAWVKHDWLTNSSLNKFAFPIESIGGQDLGGGISISPYYSLRYGWRVQFAAADQDIVIVGNIITDTGDNPVVDNPGAYDHSVRFVLSANSLTTDIGGAGLTADQVWDLANGVETNLTPREAMRLLAAASAGKLSGAAGPTVTIRNVGDTKSRIVATVDDDGNRTSVTTDPT